MSSNAAMRDIDERTNLTGNSMFELLLFRLGEARGTSKRFTGFGINAEPSGKSAINTRLG